MKSLIRKCTACGRYTMEDSCPDCSASTSMAIPQRYSPSDRFQKYRLKERM
ncbi:MAG: RNA-protein complex protein Nop10 [Candidatus Thermoplasmatota archaeon]|nr:RNA-protein complex protein Nop10 [Candidatus Thermoplasmatota archaeon]